MITSEQAEKIKETIGTNYSVKIANYLNKRAERNSHGLPYTAHYIRNVVAGQENEDLENLIFDAANFYRLKNKREERRRKAILQST